MRPASETLTATTSNTDTTLIRAILALAAAALLLLALAACGGEVGDDDPPQGPEVPDHGKGDNPDILDPGPGSSGAPLPADSLVYACIRSTACGVKPYPRVSNCVAYYSDMLVPLGQAPLYDTIYGCANKADSCSALKQCFGVADVCGSGYQATCQDGKAVFCDLLELPFAFFGHGMGALVAFELSHRLRAQGLPGPEHLFVAGQPAPQLDQPFGPLAALPDEALTAAVTRLGGIPQGVLRRPSFLALVLADLRADFRLCANYGHDQTRRPLGCPITAFGGGGDPLVSGWQLRAWSFQTRGRFELRILSGGQRFLRASRSHVLAVVRERLPAPAEALRYAS